MWERYGFYVVQTLLALYLALHFKWPDKQIYTLIGSFTALTYISPVLGGWIADHLIGQKRATFLGTFFLFFSYISLAVQSTADALPLSLAGIAVGTGLLKSNISSLLGNQYPKNSASRESGFTIFYMGITSGIILGTTLPSYFNLHFGWSISFVSAAIGILIGVFTFAFGIHRYQIADYHPYQFDLNKNIQATLMVATLWGSAWFIMMSPKFANSIFCLVVILSLSYILFCIYKEQKKQAKKTAVILLLCVISAMFWTFYFQMFLSLTLFISRVVQPTIFGLLFPPPYYVAIQSIGMIIIGVFLARDKVDRPQYQKTIRAGNKFLLSMVVMTLAYALIVLVSHVSLQSDQLLSPLWIIPAYLLISLAELLLSPVGLSAVTLLANRKHVSTMMGIFFVSLGTGGFLSGKLASLTALPLGELSRLQIKLHYAEAFTKIFWILLALTISSIFLNIAIRRLMKGTA
ncbi:MAG: oligopeptide:H+ symporter [Gammaproteobacteria bacterium]|nr:oligopeptide:H+ symporter [Gammaproteobacteria bacterium]MCH9764156.1 oligopeptide:H+ symporter [Gammaproteobacteria bacterium]